MFNLAVSCLTMFNLPWFMDLTFQVPMQYCSLQHQTLLSPADTSTAECHFCFGPAASFFLGLLVIALHSSPAAYWTPSDIEGSSSSVISFCLFILFMGFTRQEYQSGLPVPPQVEHILPVPWPGIKPMPPALEGKVLTTGLPRKSLKWFVNDGLGFGISSRNMLHEGRDFFLHFLFLCCVLSTWFLYIFL